MPAVEGFAMPEALQIDEKTATDRYAKFLAEPFETGFGHTLGNALRRVLLSSLDGVAVASVRIDGVPHEFTSIPDVIEDVTEIVLNVKKLRVTCAGELPRTLELEVGKAGAITAAAVREDGVTKVLNPELHLFTLDRDRKVRMEIVIDSGRGYRPADENKRADQPIGVIPVDSLFSPVERVRYDVQACRVGQRTDYDRLELEVWTDGRVSPEHAVRRAAAILQQHLVVFTKATHEEEEETQSLSAEEETLVKKLCGSVADLELSVRARNCLHNANIQNLGGLVVKTEAEMLKYRNFGKKSLDEIKEKLAALGLGLEMSLPDNVVKAVQARAEPPKEEE
ncbi:MAG: DNA-directed RNA polymerase subunit alpha [Lentisphaerae bacterium ADurb.BinA184]|nr:MAG: DNA-directed RNA polymerase subunit alpha [Lentisphaerae bacterium ADurb.BinA184]